MQAGIRSGDVYHYHQMMPNIQSHYQALAKKDIILSIDQRDYNTPVDDISPLSNLEHSRLGLNQDNKFPPAKLTPISALKKEKLNKDPT